MRVPPLPEVASALLASVVTWAAWPWWGAQADAWLPALPATLGILVAYAAFRVVLTPVRAAFSWLLVAAARGKERPPAA